MRSKSLADVEVVRRRVTLGSEITVQDVRVAANGIVSFDGAALHRRNAEGQTASILNEADDELTGGLFSLRIPCDAVANATE